MFHPLSQLHQSRLQTSQANSNSTGTVNNQFGRIWSPPDTNCFNSCFQKMLQPPSPPCLCKIHKSLAKKAQRRANRLPFSMANTLLHKLTVQRGNYILFSNGFTSSKIKCWRFSCSHVPGILIHMWQSQCAGFAAWKIPAFCPYRLIFQVLCWYYGYEQYIFIFPQR